MNPLSHCLERHLNRELWRPVLTLGFASAAACGLLLLRIHFSGHWQHLYLVWNLILAWLPLFFAIAVWRMQVRGKTRTWQVVTAAGAWLAFFPNAPYICTDLIHLGPKSHGIFWVDLVLILLFALTGLGLGFLSLFLMQASVTRRWGWPAGWGFAVGAAAFAGFGIYLGRFLRWNSWDMLLNPVHLLADVFQWFGSVASHPASGIVPALFATLVLLAYVMFHGLTYLPENLRASGQDSVGTQR